MIQATQGYKTEIQAPQANPVNCKLDSIPFGSAGWFLTILVVSVSVPLAYGFVFGAIRAFVNKRRGVRL